MAFDAPFGQHNYLGKHAGEAAALTWIRAQKWDTSKDGLGSPENGMTFYDTSANSYKAYVNGSWVDAGGTGFHDHDHSASGTEGGQLDHATAFSAYGTDDHTEYILATGSRDFSGVVNGVTPTADAHLATKGYVDALVDGLKWLPPVLGIQVDATLDPGASPAEGDSYILTNVSALHANFGTITGVGDNDVVTYRTSAFVITYDASVEGEGAAAYNEADNKRYTYNGTAWVLFSDLVNHNDLANIQGGTTDEYYHLTSANYTTLRGGSSDASSLHNHGSLYYTETEIDAMFNASTGHDHDGTDSKKVDYANLLNIPSTFAPSAHASSHNAGGGDAMAIDAVAGTGSLRTLGTSATSACAGNDSRLSDARTPTSHASSHENGGGDEISVLGLSGLLADAQTPAAHVIDPGSGPHTGSLLEANVTFNGSGHDHSGTTNGSVIDHVNLSNKGTNTHAQIDTHISDVSIHTETYNGAGTPNGVVTAANIGDRYLDTTNMILYVKSTAGGNTGWVVA